MEKTKYLWGSNVPYNDYSSYVRNKFDQRVQKLTLNVGFTCPNRDGTRGVGGCTFCNNDTFNPIYCGPDKSITDQLNYGISLFKDRYPDQEYLAYFQAYTNTYAPLEQLKRLYEEALAHPRIIGLVVGTRPDCLPDELVDYFAGLQKDFYVVVELGIESTREETLLAVNRGHTFEETRAAVLKLNQAQVPVGGHMILGLPGESQSLILNHAQTISELPLTFLKLHQLQYVKGSLLGRQYLESPESFKVFELEEYIDLVVAFLEKLSPAIVVERLASEAPFDLLLAPKWGLKNFELVEKVKKRMRQKNTWQGRCFNLGAR
jgi:radical SAM protein (TIGR01212 family)